MLGYIIKRLLLLAVVIAGIYVLVQNAPVWQEWANLDRQETGEAGDLSDEADSYKELPASGVPLVQAILPGTPLPQGVRRLLEKGDAEISSGRFVLYAFPEQLEGRTETVEWELDDHGAKLHVAKQGGDQYELSVVDENGKKVCSLTVRTEGDNWVSTRDTTGRDVAILLPNDGGEQEARAALLMPKIELTLPSSGEGLSIPASRSETIGKMTPQMLETTEYELRLNKNERVALNSLESSLRGKAVRVMQGGLKMPNVAQSNNVVLKVQDPVKVPFECSLDAHSMVENTLVAFNVQLEDRYDLARPVLKKLLTYVNTPRAAAKFGNPSKAFSIAHVYYLLSLLPKQASEPEEQRKTAIHYASLFLNSEWREFCEKNLSHLPMPDHESVTFKGGRVHVFDGSLRQLTRLSGHSTQSYLCKMLSEMTRNFFNQEFASFAAAKRPLSKLCLDGVRVGSDGHATWFFTLR